MVFGLKNIARSIDRHRRPIPGPAPPATATVNRLRDFAWLPPLLVRSRSRCQREREFGTGLALSGGWPLSVPRRKPSVVEEWLHRLRREQVGDELVVVKAVVVVSVFRITSYFARPANVLPMLWLFFLQHGQHRVELLPEAGNQLFLVLVDQPAQSAAATAPSVNKQVPRSRTGARAERPVGRLALRISASSPARCARTGCR